MRTWAVGFILGSMLCLAGIFVWVGLQTLNGNPVKPQDIKVTEETAEPEVAIAVEETTPEAETTTVVADTDPEEESEVQTETVDAEPEVSVEPEVTDAAEPEVAPKPEEQAPKAEEPTVVAEGETAATETETTATETTEPATEEPAPEQSVASRLPKITAPEVANGEPEVQPEAVDDGSPKMAIILVDIGEEGLSLDALAALEYPVSFAISPAREDAGERAQTYEKHGKTILALSPEDVEFSLSGNLSKSQVATLLNRYFAIMPSAVGLLDRPEATLQVDRQLSRAVVATFKKSGKALVTYQKGLNSLLKDASNEQVPAAKIYKSLDASDEDEAAMLRLLDRAVLEATQSGQVVVQGNATDATIAAIEKWRASSRADTVSLVSIKRVLPKGQE